MNYSFERMGGVIFVVIEETRLVMYDTKPGGNDDNMNSLMNPKGERRRNINPNSYQLHHRPQAVFVNEHYDEIMSEVKALILREQL